MKNIVNWFKKSSPGDLIAALGIMIPLIASSFVHFSEPSSEEIRQQKYSVSASQTTFFVVDEGGMYGEGQGNIRSMRLKLPPNVAMVTNGRKSDKIAYDRISIINKGSEVIRRDDFIEAISIEAPLGISIISATAAEDSERWQPTVEGNTLILPKKDFNTGEKIRINIVYEFTDKEWQKKWKWRGILAHVKEIEYQPTHIPQSLDHLNDDDLYLRYRKAFLKENPSGIHIMLAKWEILVLLVFFALCFNFALVISKWKNWSGYRFWGLVKVMILAMISMAIAEIFTYIVYRRFDGLDFAIWVWVFCGVLYGGLIILFRYTSKSGKPSSP